MDGFEIKIICNPSLDDNENVGYLMISQKEYNNILKRKTYQII